MLPGPDLVLDGGEQPVNAEFELVDLSTSRSIPGSVKGQRDYVLKLPIAKVRSLRIIQAVVKFLKCIEAQGGQPLMNVEVNLCYLS